MTDTELSEICAYKGKTRLTDQQLVVISLEHIQLITWEGECTDEQVKRVALLLSTIPALLAHIDLQQKEIAHLRRALEYACKFGEKLCHKFEVVSENGCFDCPVMLERDRISPAPICKNWLSASLDATKEAASE